MKIAFLKKAAAARAPMPSSPLLRAVGDPAQRRSLWRRWGAAAVVLVAAAAPALAVVQRWFDPGGLFRPLYAVHDDIFLPVVGRLWTAWFPWGLVYLIPAVVAGTLTLCGFMSGRRPLRGVQRRIILAAAGRDGGADLLCGAHRLQCSYGLPGRFMRMVIVNAADAAVDAVLFTVPDVRASEDGDGGRPQHAARDVPQHAAKHPRRQRDEGLARAWRLVAMRGEMTADARPGRRAAFAAAAQIALLWLKTPPAEERTRRRIRAAWQHLWLTLAPKAGTDDAWGGRPTDRVGRWLRHELAVMEATIADIERRGFGGDAASAGASPAASASRHSWERYAERIVAATFLAGIAPGSASLAAAVIDAVERVAMADLAAAADGDCAVAEAVARAIDVTQARQAASLIGARIDAAAAADLQWWREDPTAANKAEQPRPDDLAPALRGLAEAALDPRADRPAEACR